MSVNGDFFRFQQGELAPVTDTLSDSLSVADSFLLENGNVRGFEKHFSRFAGSVKAIADEDLAGFRSAVLKLLPRTSAWFPRLEYRAGQSAESRLGLRLRPAPERSATLTLWTCNESDRRENFAVKGPDLSLCQQYRRQANLHGADEAVLLSTDGFIADGALSSIVWLRNQTLFVPDDSTNWLPSITREYVIDLARQAGFGVEQTRATPADLAGAEVWSLSALQGIRGVVGWQGVEIEYPRLHLPFRKRLGLLAQALPEN